MKKLSALITDTDFHTPSHPALQACSVTKRLPGTLLLFVLAVKIHHRDCDQRVVVSGLGHGMTLYLGFYDSSEDETTPFSTKSGSWELSFSTNPPAPPGSIMRSN